jgi:hypothetical protein
MALKDRGFDKQRGIQDKTGTWKKDPCPWNRDTKVKALVGHITDLEDTQSTGHRERGLVQKRRPVSTNPGTNPIKCMHFFGLGEDCGEDIFCSL